MDALERQDSRGLLEGGSPVEEEEGGDAAQAEADWFMNPQLSAERTRLRSLTVPRLKEELKAAGKIRTGKKAELMARLVDATKEHWAAHGTILSECTGEVSPEPDDESTPVTREDEQQEETPTDSAGRSKVTQPFKQSRVV